MGKKHFYDDEDFSYRTYWQKREYENSSEVMAINRLLGKRHFKNSADIGGGFGRLTKILSGFSKNTILVEPSEKMREMAADYLKDTRSIKIISGTSEKTNLDSQSLDLVTSFRVFHHIPELQSTFEELTRIIKPDGLILFEFANSINFKSRIHSIVTGKPILVLPIDRRSQTNIRNQTIHFVNHHPVSIHKILKRNSFKVIKILSVSNFRFQILKKLIPIKVLLVLEYLFQTLFSGLYFGPSIFVLAQKN
jgi:ubiquinone/menaquinone biosynthesis C-methylase UbiE